MKKKAEYYTDDKGIMYKKVVYKLCPKCKRYNQQVREWKGKVERCKGCDRLIKKTTADGTPTNQRFPKKKSKTQLYCEVCNRYLKPKITQPACEACGVNFKPRRRKINATNSNNTKNSNS